MKIGYVSNLFLGDNEKIMLGTINSFANTMDNQNLGFLVLSGGISRNYKTTLEFLRKMKMYMGSEKFAFLAGNTDFYYLDSVVDKEAKFREILEIYRNHESYLPQHTKTFPMIRLYGNESWYDYTLYRGNSVELEKITKKSKMWYYNHDVDYITNKTDYTLGVNNLFDTRYCNETIQDANAKMSEMERKHGVKPYSVVVQYFSPSKNFLKPGRMYYYSGTFQGSMKYLDVIQSHYVTDIVIGSEMGERSYQLGKYRVINPVKEIMVLEYADK